MQAVCGKCCIDTYELETNEAIWLCKICSESREVLKKTNMWTQLHGLLDDQSSAALKNTADFS